MDRQSTFLRKGAHFPNFVWRRLLELDKPLPDQTDGEIEAQVARNYGWNFSVNLLDGIFFWLGMSFVSTSTIVPLFVSKLTMNPLVIGLVAVIAQSSWFLPQIFVADSIERLARKRPVVVNLGFFFERLPAWLWPLAAWLALDSPLLALVLFFIGFAWHGLGSGVVAPAWQDLIANCFPVSKRGRFLGLTMFLGALAGTVGAVLSSRVLDSAPFPSSFVQVFMIAAICMSFSWFFLALTREPIRPRPPQPASHEKFWKKVGAIVAPDRNFRRFLLARLVMALGPLGTGFVAVAAVQRWQVPDGTVAFYTVALLLGQAGGNLVSGVVADRFGHKLSLEFGVAAAVAAFALAWLAPVPGLYFAVFVLLGFFSGAVTVSGLLIPLEFCSPDRRPSYAGITNSVAGLTGAVAPLIGGLLGGISYSLLFAASAAVNLLALALLLWTVQEPRGRPVP